MFANIDIMFNYYQYIAEQTYSVVTQVCKESKLWIRPNLRRPSFSFTYLS